MLSYIIFATTKSLFDLSPLPHTSANNSTTQTVLNIAFSIIGGLAFFVVVLAGTRYVFARDNAESIQKSRNTLLYALIGLVLVIFSAAIVNLLISKLGK